MSVASDKEMGLASSVDVAAISAIGTAGRAGLAALGIVSEIEALA